MENQLQCAAIKPRKNDSIIIVVTSLLSLSISFFLVSYCCGIYQMQFVQFSFIKNFLTKKAMFFFFNAILLFVAKDFSSAEKSIYVQDLAPVQQLRPPKKEAVAEEAVHFENLKPCLTEGNNGCQEGDEDVGEMEELGIDELNKKFEEFIERVKREREIETLQLVMVSVS